MQKNKLLNGLLLALVAAGSAQAQSSGQATTGVNAGKPTTSQSGMAGQQGAMGSSGTAGTSRASDQSAQGSASSGQSAAGSMAASPAPVVKGDQKIVSDLAMGNMAEIELAKLAQSKSQNDQVKTFAQQMIDDHGKSLTDVQALAKSKGITLPTELDKAHKAETDKLAKLSGDAFDKAYLARGGVSDHKKMHNKLASAQKSAKDPDVKALVAKTIPTVDQHLNAAEQMNSAVGSSGKAKTASGNK